jgi:lipopolysaccharide export system permease protein
MAGLTEVVAILSSGVSFRRFVAPYMVGAAVIASISLLLNMYVIPHSNAQRLEFERIYIKNQFVYKNKDVHRQISPGQFIYFESYNNIDRVGYRFSLEKFKDGKLTYKLLSERIVWDSTTSKWRIENYFIRQIVGMNETIKTGLRLDTVLAFSPEEFNRRTNYIETMDSHELDKFIEQERIRGTEELPFYLVEKHRRIAFPFATFILTLIGVSLSSRKVRGGIGVQIGAGILLSFTYIMFMQISQTFATNGNMSPMLAMWIPNIAFSFIAIYLYRKAMR